MIVTTAVVSGLGIASAAAAGLVYRVGKKRLENARKKTENVEAESETKRSDALDASLKLLQEIEEDRYFLASSSYDVEKLDKVNGLLGSARDADGKIDFYLAKKENKYAAAVEFGNLKEAEDGTYDILNLPGVSESEEKVLRLGIKQDNEFTRNARAVKETIKAEIPDLERKKEMLEKRVALSGEERLERQGAPSAQYGQTLQIIESSHAQKSEEITEGSSAQRNAEISQGEEYSPAAAPRDPVGQSPGDQGVPQGEEPSTAGEGTLHSARVSRGRQLAARARAARAALNPVSQQETTEPEMGD